MFLSILQNIPLRGMPSIRKNTMVKIRIVVGQDDSAFLLHSFKIFYWTFEGNDPLRTKTEGTGIMVSLLITREFGFAFNLTKDMLEELLVVVNENRKCTVP